MSDDTIDDSIQVTRREVIKGAAALAASTAVSALSTLAAAAASPDCASAKTATATKKLSSPELNGAAAFLRNLAANGVDTVFACPGTA